MHEIDNIDLNLYRTLHALLEEGSVTRAAERLGLGQPAVSHALGRLREELQDPLFVRAGRGIAPTPRAERMRAPIARLLADARGLRVSGAFDPATTKKTFRLIAPDLVAPALPAILSRLSARAPAADLEVLAPGSHDDERLFSGAADARLGVRPSRASGVKQRGVGRVKFAVVARRGHPALRAKLTRARWLSAPHVVVLSGNKSASVVEGALRSAGFSRRVGLTVPSFLAALYAVSSSDLLFCAPSELLGALLPRLKLEVVPLPIRLKALPIAVTWHERFDKEPATQFFRALVGDAMRELLG